MHIRPLHRPQHLGLGLSLITGLVFVLILTHSAMAERAQFFGVVISVNPAGKTIRAKDPRSGRPFYASITEETVLKEGNKAIKLEDVEAGTAVIIDYEQQGNEFIAHRIIIQTGLK